MCDCFSSSCRGFKHHRRLQQHLPVVVMATAPRRSGFARRRPLGRRHGLLGGDASSGRHRGCCRSADSWLSLSGCGDVQERQTNEPIRNHRQDRCVLELWLSFPFLCSSLIVPSLPDFQPQRQRPASPCLPPPLVDSSCLGHAPVVTGIATGCNCLTVLCY